MERSSKHQPITASGQSSTNPMDPKILREQSRSHLNKKIRQEQSAHQGQQVPYGMLPAAYPYFMMNPMMAMGLMPWMMSYFSSVNPNHFTGNDMSNQTPVPLEGTTQFVPQTASIPLAQYSNPAAIQASGNAYASMPMPLYGYPHQLPLVPLQPVQTPQAGFYAANTQLPYPSQMASAENVNPISMIKSAIKRKVFGLTYPPIGNAAPQPKMLSVETWKKIREAQKTLKHNWQSEMRLKDKPSDSERQNNGNTLDDLFPASGSPIKEKQIIKETKKAEQATPRYVQVDLLQIQTPISVQADFAYDYNAHVHGPVSNDVNACLINAETNVEQTIQSDGDEIPSEISNINDEHVLQNSTVPVSEQTELTMAVDAVMRDEDIVNHDAEQVSKSQDSVISQDVTASSMQAGLDDLFPETPLNLDIKNYSEIPSPEWKPYASKDIKKRKHVKPISLASLNSVNTESEMDSADSTEPSLWSKMVTMVQKCLLPSEVPYTKQESQNCSDSAFSISPSLAPVDEYIQLKETMAAIQQEPLEEGANTYTMWRQYKMLENKMQQQKKVIHELLSVQQSFNDKKMDYYYLPEATTETCPADMDATVTEPMSINIQLPEDMAKDLGLGTFEEIQATVEHRHAVQKNDTSVYSEEPVDHMPEAIRHVEVEVVSPETSRKADFKNRILNSIKTASSKKASFPTNVQSLLERSKQARYNVSAFSKESLDEAVKQALTYTPPIQQEAVAAAMTRHVMGMQGIQHQESVYAHSKQHQMPSQDGTYSMETTVRVEFKSPDGDPISMTHRIQEDFTIQSMLQSNRMLSKSISSLADEYFKHTLDEE